MTLIVSLQWFRLFVLFTSSRPQVSLYTFVSPLGSSIMSPALPDIAVHYGITNQTVVAMTLSVYLLSWAFGPLLLAPLSEIYGRTWVRTASFPLTLLAHIDL